MINDLEVWLMGTPTEVDAALTALETVGKVTGVSQPQRLYGADAGRVRRHLRLIIPTNRPDADRQSVRTQRPLRLAG
ncbi:MAG: hypothetical protein ACRDUA_14375 [Micromonosporaceae bacterium]